MTVGFIGLGRMGQGMAANLLAAGVSLSVFDIQTEATRSLTERGASLAASIAELADSSQVVLTSLPGPNQFEEVVFGSDGLSAHASSGDTLIDLSTNSLTVVRRAYERLKDRGVHLLDAPVSGGPTGAASGELAIWVGGDREVFDTHRPLLEAVGKQVRRVGDIGAGTVTKLSHNLLATMILSALSETFSLGVKAGLDPLDLWEALQMGVVGRRPPLDMLIAQFLPNRYVPPAFALKLAHKDVALATELGRDLGVPMRMAHLTLAEMTEALGQGLGEEDSRSFLKLQLARAGVTVEVDPQRLRQATIANGSQP